MDPDWQEEQTNDPYCNSVRQAFDKYSWGDGAQSCTKQELELVADHCLIGSCVYKKKKRPQVNEKMMKKEHEDIQDALEVQFPGIFDVHPDGTLKDGRGRLLPNGRSECKPPMENLKLFVVPETLRRLVWKQYHEAPFGGCHQGIPRTFEAIREKFWWKGMAEDVKNWCNGCSPCGTRKPLNHPCRHRMIPIPVHHFLERLTVDLMGAIQYKVKGGGTRMAKWPYIMVVTDHLTKYVWALPIKDTKAQTAADLIFERIVCVVGAGFNLASDRGTNFTSHVTKALMKRMGVNQIFGSSYNPCSQGLTERNNATLVNMISAYVKENPYNYHEYLPFVVFTYNNTVNPATGYTPNELVYGRRLQTPFEVTLGIGEENPEGSELLQHVARIRRLAAMC